MFGKFLILTLFVAGCSSEATHYEMNSNDLNLKTEDASSQQILHNDEYAEDEYREAEEIIAEPPVAISGSYLVCQRSYKDESEILSLSCMLSDDDKIIEDLSIFDLEFSIIDEYDHELEIFDLSFEEDGLVRLEVMLPESKEISVSVIDLNSSEKITITTLVVLENADLSGEGENSNISDNEEDLESFPEPEQELKSEPQVEREPESEPEPQIELEQQLELETLPINDDEEDEDDDNEEDEDDDEVGDDG